MSNCATFLASWAAAAGALLVDAVNLDRSPLRGTLDVRESSQNQGSAPSTQTLKNVGDVLYTLHVTVGGQHISAIPDSGSFDLLVFSKRCWICGEGPEYDDGRSGAFHTLNFSAEQSFGSGTAESIEAYDTVSVGPMAAKRQVFWEVVDADSGFADMSFSAIFGVGPPQSAVSMALQEAADMRKEVQRMEGVDPAQYKDVLAHYDEVAVHAKKQTLLLKQTRMQNYSVCLGAEPGSPGIWTWNDNAVEANPKVFKRVPVVGDTYWSSTLADVSLSAPDGKNVRLGCDGKESCSAVVDTGTSLLVMPSDAYYEFASTLDRVAAGLPGCSDLASLPSLTFKLGDQELILPPEAYVGQVDGEMGDELRRAMPHAWKAQHGTKKDCGLLVMTSDESSTEGPVWILGLPLFRQYYTSFALSPDSQKAGAMYFAEADPQCKPINVEQRLERQESSGMRRTMKVDARKLRLPSRFGRSRKRASFAKRAHLHE